MQAKQNAKKDFTTEIICAAPWRLKRVSPLKNYQLEVEFIDGVRGFVDMKQRILSPKAGVFAALQDTKIFNQVYLEYGAATWPGEIDLAPDAMYEQIKSSGKWVLEP
jgi:hypothetical protein